MRYRALDENGDMAFGSGGANYLVNSPAAVAQAVTTRLRLITGEWFLDVTAGTPYTEDVLGNGTQDTRDAAIRDRILGTSGVTAILDFSSAVVDRAYSVEATIDTIYGEATISQGFAL